MDFKILIRAFLSISLLISMSIIGDAQAQDKVSPNPGDTGTNAFEFIKYPDSIDIGNNVELKLEITDTSNAIGDAKSLVFYFRIPIQDWVTIGADYRAEYFENDDAAIEKYLIPEKSGIGFGDLNFWTMIKLLKEEGHIPGVALRVTLKTAAGDFAQTRRYTDTAGYEFSVLADKTLLEKEDGLINKIQLIMEAGFVVWDTNQAKQNDAYKVSGNLKVDSGKFNASVGIMHYKGWFPTAVDSFVGIQTQVTYRMNEKIAFDFTIQQSLSQVADKSYYGAGVRYYIDKSKKKDGEDKK